MSFTTREQFKEIYWRWLWWRNLSVELTAKSLAWWFYAWAWVDIQAWDDFSAYCKKLCTDSYWNSPFVESVDFMEWNFRWARWFTLKSELLPTDIYHTLAPDWIWTKVVLIDSISEHETAWANLLAMTIDDIARYWWLPLVFSNVFDVRSIWEDEAAYRKAMDWLALIAKQQDIVILNWETAELNKCVSSPNSTAKTAFNWSWVAYWVYSKKLMITWNKIRPWNILVALGQPWFRSNWISAVRRAFEIKYWSDWYNTAPKDEIRQAAYPSLPYAKIISQANGWYNKWNPLVNITWVAHLSWWSFKWKLLEDMLAKTWFSAEFDNLFDIPEIVQKCALWSQDSDKPIATLEDLYTTWCCWQGMIVSVENKNDARKLIEISARCWVPAKQAWIVIENSKVDWVEESRVVINDIWLAA